MRKVWKKTYEIPLTSKISRTIVVEEEQIICDECGEEIINTEKKNTGKAYIISNGKYYHPLCYEIHQVKSKPKSTPKVGAL